MAVNIITGATGTDRANVFWALDATAFTTSAADGYPGINVTNPNTFSSWRGIGNTPVITLDFGSSRVIDAVGISAHNMATSGDTGFSMFYSVDNVTYTFLGTVATLTNEDVIVMFTQINARYFRIRVDGPSANIGVIAVGKRLVFPSCPVGDYVPLHHARRYEKEFNRSTRGAMINNRSWSAGAQTDVDAWYVTRAFADNELPPFENHFNKGGYFFYAGSPAAIPKDMGYCYAGEDDGILNVTFIAGTQLATLTFSLRSYVGV